MRNKLLTVALGALMLGVMAIPTSAATAVKDVYISIVPDEDDEFSPGEIVAGGEPETTSSQYYIDGYDTSSSNYTPRKTYTYTIDIIAESGYCFSDDVRVIVYGATEVTTKSKSSNILTIKAKTYPFYVLDEVANIVVDETGKKATWDKVNYAKKYNVVIRYTNSSGNEKETKKTVTKNEIDLSGYVGKYDDVSISVQAVKGTTDGDKFISSSDYISSENGNVDNNLSEDEYTFSIPTAASDGSNATYSGSTIGSALTSYGIEGWNGSGNIWYYIYNGSRVTGWLHINDDWYLMDSSGNMLYGWQYADNAWYYLNTAHDGYFGRMYADTTTPDGYRVDVSGAWIQ